MHTRLLNHIRHNVVAYLALFVALGGTSYAVVNLPANSVGARQLRNHAITPVKLDPKSIAASVRAWAIVYGDNHTLRLDRRAVVDSRSNLISDRRADHVARHRFPASAACLWQHRSGPVDERRLRRDQYAVRRTAAAISPSGIRP